MPKATSLKFFASLLFCTLLFSQSSIAQISGGIDLEATMKQMRFEYKQLMKTRSIDKFNQHLSLFKEKLAVAQTFPFTKARKEKALEGLGKVAKLVDSILVPTNQEMLLVEQQKLRVIDQLREQYHDKKEKGIWQIMFGSDDS